jgi:hypothetical protein
MTFHYYRSNSSTKQTTQIKKEPDSLSNPVLTFISSFDILKWVYEQPLFRPDDRQL